MHSVQGEPQYYGDGQRSRVISPPVPTFPSEWTPSPTWAAPSPAGLCFLAERPWQAAAVSSDRGFPGYYYKDGSGPFSEQTLDPESFSEPSKPTRVEFLSFVLGTAFAWLLQGIGLLIIHNSLSPYDVTPDVADGAIEQWLEIAPNTVGQRFIPKRAVHPDVDEKGNRKTTTSARTRVRVAGRATKGRTALLLLMRVMTCPVMDSTSYRSHNTGSGRRRRATETCKLANYLSCNPCMPWSLPAVTLESYSGHVYTPCGHPKHEFYCSAFRKACVLAATDPAHVCNRGSKWFSSIKSCLASSVNGRHVLDRCYGSTLFFPCTRQDVLDVPRYFDGKKCVAWSFPQGTCLSVGRRGVYRSWEECRRRCVLPHRVGVRRDASCRDVLTSPAEAPFFRRHAGTRWSSLCQRDPARTEVAPHLDRV
ncbi:hypothetical protein MRX96_028251 [Rhipicephalus microplus]